MMTRLIICSFFCFSFFACQEEVKKDVSSASITDKEPHFPIQPLLQAEWLTMQQQQIVPNLTTIAANGDSSSIMLTPQITSDWLQPFLQLDVSNTTQFKESRFLDATTKRVLITYESLERKTPLLRCDISIANTMDGDKVKSVYYERQWMDKDTSIVEKGLWTIGKASTKTTIKLLQDTSFTQVERLSW